MIYPKRLTGRRIFVPGFGIIPYVRGLQLSRRRGESYFRVNVGGQVWDYGCFTEDCTNAVMAALRKLEELTGNLYTGRVLRQHDTARKKNPTGHAGIYKLPGSSSWAYRVTCPYETDEQVSSLGKAIIVRLAAREEYERKNTHTLKQFLKMVEPLETQLN